MRRVIILSFIVIIFIFGFSVFGFAKAPEKIEKDKKIGKEVVEDTTKVRLELIEERALTKDVEMQLAKEMGKRIMISNDKDKRISNLLFYDKNGKLVHTISGEFYKIGYLIAQDGKSAGVLYASKNSFPEDPRDSLVTYDSLGRRKWGIKKGDDGADLVLDNLRKLHLSAGERLFLKGNRLVAIQNHMQCTPTYRTKDGLKVLFFKDGKKVKEVIVPHPYFWQAGWSPDGEMFVISVPGRSAAGISKDDVIYAYDKNGNELWNSVIIGAHFMPSSLGNVKCLVITKKYIIQTYGDYIYKKPGILFMDYKGNIIKKLNPERTVCYLSVSSNNHWLIAWERWDCFLIDINRIKILKGWNYREFEADKAGFIKYCFFNNDNLILVKGMKHSKILNYEILMDNE